ncbi:MAG: DUF4114 domain-containing protein, partial [Planctomycetes bacterium]|nr:DUF4114 domain-containing protein [Planctomycetota bacterium]
MRRRGERSPWQRALRLEALEDRLLLAVFSVANTDDGGAGSLRQAILDANANVGADTILLPAGTYTLTIAGGHEDAGATGDLDINDDLTITGAGTATTIVQGCDADADSACIGIDTIFDVESAIVQISGLTIRKGYEIYGAGICNSVGTLTLTDSVVSDNTGVLYAGGIYNFLGTLTLNNTTISGNSGGSSRGGGIYSSTLVINGGVISGNSADQWGGGVFQEGGTVTISNAAISANSSAQGGGIFNTGGALTISDSTLSGNTAGSGGGGIFNDGAGNVTITNSTLSGNTAGTDGGGIFNQGALTITNSTFSGNTAHGSGGGIRNGGDDAETGGGTLGLLHVTITNNTADDDNDGTGDGGGVFDSTGFFDVASTIIAGNSDRSGEAPDAAGTLDSLGFNLLQNTAGMTISGNTTGNILGREPFLRPLSNYGGPTLTHALLPESPALDAANPVNFPATDQRGIARPEGVAPDMGAFEYVFGSIHGQKFHDLDGDGQRDPGEPGLDGWTIQLFDGQGNLIANQVTMSMDLNGDGQIDPVAEQGLYWFRDLVTGRYRVAEVLQDGWRPSSPPQATTFVAPGAGGLDGPQGLVFGPDGNLYVSSAGNDAVLRYEGTTGRFIDVFASGGGLSDPQNLVFGPDGHLYVASEDNRRVLRYDGNTGAFIDTFVAEGSGGLVGPTGLAFGPDGNLYVASGGTPQILRYHGTTGAFIDEFIFTGSGSFDQPVDLTFGPDGNVYVAKQSQEVAHYDGETGAFIDTFVSAGSGGIQGLLAAVFAPDNNLYVSCGGPCNSIRRYDGTTGAFIDVYIPSSHGGLSAPDAFLFGRNGSLFVTSFNTDAVLRFDRPPSHLGASYDVFLVEPQIVANGRDFGNFQTASIHGRKFHDPDGDGVWDQGFHSFFDCKTEPCPSRPEQDGEPGVNGWQIQLFDADGNLVASTTTMDVDLNGDGAILPDRERGLYWFTDLPPGTYTLAEVPQPGWVQTFPGALGRHGVTLTSGQVIEELNFGNAPAPDSVIETNVLVVGTVADDLSGVASLVAQIDGGPFFEVMFDAAGNFGFPTDFALDGSEDGRHRVRLQATDEAGNVSGFVDVFFTLQTPETCDRVFMVPGLRGQEVRLTWTFSSTAFENEVGVFEADDDAGRVDGLLPADPGYAERAIRSGRVVFHSGQGAGAERELIFSGGDRLVFYIIQNDTTKELLWRNPGNSLAKLPLAFFSLEEANPDAFDHARGRNLPGAGCELGWEDLTFGGDQDFNDVVFTVEASGYQPAAVFRGGMWFFDLDGRGGRTERSFAFGLPGDVPVAGDWDGDGETEVGVFRGGAWF